MIIHVNFNYILGECAYLELLRAYRKTFGKTAKESLQIDSWYGKSWTARLINPKQDDILLVEWRLCEGMLECPLYIWVWIINAFK